MLGAVSFLPKMPQITSLSHMHQITFILVCCLALLSFVFWIICDDGKPCKVVMLMSHDSDQTLTAFLVIPCRSFDTKRVYTQGMNTLLQIIACLSLISLLCLAVATGCQHSMESQDCEIHYEVQILHVKMFTLKNNFWIKIQMIP
jgi:hypothetical protein